MLAQLLSKKRVCIPLVLVLVFVASSLLYLHSVKRQATLAEIQEALYRQRVRQYLKDREEWNKKFHQAHTERMQAGEAVVSFIPNLSPNRSAEAIATYLNSLSDAERKQLFAEYDVLVAKSEAAIKKLEAVKQEEPIFPQRSLELMPKERMMH